MQPSMEVRWFLLGDLPKDVQAWFEAGAVLGPGVPFHDETRKDTYLFLAGNHVVGIKVRAGDKVEVKKLHRDGGVQSLANGSQGRMEQWVKWSFDFPEKDETDKPITLPDLSSPAGSWIDIDKRRLLRKYAVISEVSITAIDARPGGPRPNEGCQLEVAWVKANGQVWWSLGFESFGSLNSVETNLSLVLKHVLADPAFPKFQAQDSFGFPAWLDVVASRK